MYRLSLIFISLLLSSLAYGHQLSTAYLQASVSSTGVITGELQVRLYDLDQALGLDANADGKLLWREVQARETDISLYLSQHLKFSRSNHSCEAILPTPWQIDSHFNEAYLVLPVRAQCSIEGDIKINYSSFFNEDSQHKLLLSWQWPEGSGTASASRVISAEQPEINFSTEGGNRLASFIEFIHQGMIHIWIGVDHILFLCSLLLSCVLTRRNKQWLGKKSIREIIIHTTWIVTAFTLAHSLTLTATALDIINFSSRWVEVGIALSVMLAALNNIFPVVLRLGLLTFCFGLLHGMGFAGALGELGIPADQQMLAVLAFNLGVEMGQMAIVLLLLPILIFVRHKAWYARYALIGLSLIIALLAAQWVLQRIAN